MGAQKNKDSKRDYLFIIAILIALSATIFWLLLLTHAYNTFQYGTFDLADETYNIYVNLHYANLVHGLQVLVLSENLSPDVLLILPIFYLHQSALTLVYLQVIVMGITSIIIFLVARRLVKDSLIAIAFSTAFLLNAGVAGILTFDFHMEFLMIPFYILTFYYYMTSNKKLFAVSLLLLLGTLEAAPLLSFTLALGLFAYEKTISKGKAIPKDKKLMIAVMLLASIIAVVFYYGAIKYLTYRYSTAYPQLPGIIEIGNGHFAGLLSSISGITSGPIKWLESLLIIYKNPGDFTLLIVSIPLTFLSFGIFTVYRPKITLLLLLPWLVAIIFEGWTKTAFLIYPGLYGYSYTIGATFAAATIGAMYVVNKSKGTKKNMRYLVTFSTILIALILAMFSLFIAAAPLVFLVNYHNANPIPTYNTTDINQLISMIPQNASLFTQNPIAPHVAERRYLEYPAAEEVTNSYFVPDYMLVTYSNLSDYVSSNFTISGNFNSLLNNYTYRLEAVDGDARLYELNQSAPNNPNSHIILRT